MNLRTAFFSSLQGNSTSRQAPILLNSDYFFVNRPDLEKKSLLWGEGEHFHKTKKQFKSIMRIELRKSIPSLPFLWLLLATNMIMLV
jgi:hypothetical protein